MGWDRQNQFVLAGLVSTYFTVKSARLSNVVCYRAVSFECRKTKTKVPGGGGVLDPCLGIGVPPRV